jgi:hypothetical protein
MIHPCCAVDQIYKCTKQRKLKGTSKMLAFNFTFVLSVIFPNSFSESRCSLLSVAPTEWVPYRHRHGHRKHVPTRGVFSAACSPVSTSLVNGRPLLQACLCSWKTSQCSALLFARNFCGEGRATQMSLPASDVTNGSRVPHRLQLHFVAACTAFVSMHS